MSSFGMWASTTSKRKQASAPVDVFGLHELAAHRIPVESITLSTHLSSGPNVDLLLGTTASGHHVTAKRLHETKRIEKAYVESFVNEIKLHATLDSPYIVRFVGVTWTSPWTLTMVTEYVDGASSLRDVLQETTPSTFPWTEKFQCALHVASALVYLHARELLHRDVKAANVVVDASTNTHKLTGFDVASDETLSSIGGGGGSMRWMAPEALRDGRNSAAADMYSFGVLLSELATHRMPYDNLTTAAGAPLSDFVIVTKVMNGDLRPEMTTGAPRPRWFVDLAHQCLAVDPTTRPSALHVVCEIKTHLASHDDNGDWDNDESIDMLNLVNHRLPTTDVVVAHQIGSGSAADVFLADFLGTSVALKRLLPQKATQRHDVDAFLEEIRLVAACSSPFVVAFIGVMWTRPSDVALVTEYMDRGDLRDYLATVETFPWLQKLTCASDVANALVYLHTHMHIIHRDVKSRNVLLNGKMQSKLTDFGIARDVVDGHMTAGMGTYRWMAPEVLHGTHYDTSADLYSFGVVLSELETHRLPYAELKNSSGTNPLPDTAIVAKVMAGDLQPTFTSTCPAPFLKLAKQCLSFEPQKRPTAMQAAYAIKQMLSDKARPTLDPPRPREQLLPVLEPNPSPVVATQHRPNPRTTPMFAHKAILPRGFAPFSMAATLKRPTNNSVQLVSSSSPDMNAALDGLERCRIDKDDIQCMRKLATDDDDGSFQVHYGKWHGQAVAIKTLSTRPPSNAAVVDFIAEIQVRASVESEYIVAFRGAMWTHRPIDTMLVMEWMVGGDLGHVLGTHPSQPDDDGLAWPQRLQIAHDVAHALSYLHARNIPHRHLHPKKVLLTTHWRAKLSNVGRTTKTREKLWTAPEVMAGSGPHDKAADMYAMGVLLFVLDRTPHSGMAALESFQASGESPVLSPVAPRWYVDLCRKCLSGSPTSRPNARQVAFELEQRLDNDRMDHRVVYGLSLALEIPDNLQ
ncbi:Aste57867_3718 [Aphanomyces stellatus]|uniref:Aste57867_3718 protein n=1 Tax=Aphanomyces stellatus TaxID=120398 RepID=A0A485KFY7_9STRA|nr:hypothetical protein As57867_003707 [Aphanomyces stellatus]VFT80872.1 Aste57867_3718 [Aphanomyces stellatus]